MREPASQANPVRQTVWRWFASQSARCSCGFFLKIWGKVFTDPQVIHRGMRLELKSPAAKGGVIPGIRTPIVLDEAPMASERPSPRLGEHTADILREIGER